MRHDTSVLGRPWSGAFESSCIHMCSNIVQSSCKEVHAVVEMPLLVHLSPPVNAVVEMPLLPWTENPYKISPEWFSTRGFHFAVRLCGQLEHDPRASLVGNVPAENDGNDFLWRFSRLLCWLSDPVPPSRLLSPASLCCSSLTACTLDYSLQGQMEWTHRLAGGETRGRRDRTADGRERMPRRGWNFLGLQVRTVLVSYGARLEHCLCGSNRRLQFLYTFARAGVCVYAGAPHRAQLSRQR